MPDATSLHKMRVRRRRCVRSGSVMLELLISIALFVGAAGFTLSAMRSALDGARRAELRARAVDLAETRLAQLDAGLISTGELGEGSAGTNADALEEQDLEVVVEFTPSSTASNLVLARATVREVIGGEPGSIVFATDRLVTSDPQRDETDAPRAKAKDR